MPPKKVTPKKNIKKSTVKKPSTVKKVIEEKVTEEVNLAEFYKDGKVAAVKKTGSIKYDVCRKYQGLKGVVCGRGLDYKTIQLMFAHNDILHVHFFPAECLTILSKEKTAKFWEDLDRNFIYLKERFVLNLWSMK